MNPKLVEFLRRKGVAFNVMTHPDAYTAGTRTAACRSRSANVAKVVVIRDDQDDWAALAVIPARARVDFARLRGITGRPRLRLATEAELSRLFPDCETGTMPPFGRMYGGLDVYLDRALVAGPELLFPGGTHREEVRIPTTEYLRVEGPDVTQLTVERRAA